MKVLEQNMEPIFSITAICQYNIILCAALKLFCLRISRGQQRQENQRGCCGTAGEALVKPLYLLDVPVVQLCPQVGRF